MLKNIHFMEKKAVKRNRGTKKTCDLQEIRNKIADKNPVIPVMALKVNELNNLVKRKR